MINHIFEDCDKIAQTYNRDISEVVMQFTIFEENYRTNNKKGNIDEEYKTIINNTERYFKSIYGGKE